MKQFLLVDDHVVVRSGLKMMMQEYFKPCEIMEASNGEEAKACLSKKQFDLIMLDIQMPNTDSLALMEYIHENYPDFKVLMFSMSAENIYAKRYLKAGARGFVSKDAPLQELNRAINQVLENRKYVSENLAMVLANDYSKGKSDNPFNRLSAREFEIAKLLLGGQTISDISKSINIQISTVGTHKSRLFEKLSVTNLLELKELATSYNL
ncbi:MAG: response regulator [Ferruginibacter sp.]